MKKLNKTPLAAALGTALVSSLGAATVSAEVNPFGISELSGGYMQLAEAKTGKGEMKCGANMAAMKKDEMKCGANMAAMKKDEMKCGAKMGMKEGTCGEGQCGAMMMGEAPKMPTEGKCVGKR
ncbi:MAG: hypothetical protein ABGX28_04200 [Methylococcales bacterium]|nr:hypothetical protein [Methylococcaceae bacterium]HIL39821.1 hypothetical protein [Methylococcales bacterium]